MACLVKIDDHMFNLDHVIEARFSPAGVEESTLVQEPDMLYLRLDGVRVEGDALGPDEIRLHGPKARAWWDALTSLVYTERSTLKTIPLGGVK